MARRWPIGRACFGLTLAAESSVHFPAAGCCPGVSVGGEPGNGRCAMAGAAVRESTTFAGRADQVREARAFVGRLLGPLHPCSDVAVLLVSEMVTNSLLHGGSSVLGDAVVVTVVVGDAGVRVEVTGRKADGVPVLRRPDDEAEGSRGLWLVEELAARWGYERGTGQATTWFEIQALLQPMQHSAVPGKGLNSPDVEVPGS
jgi:anti-sigma regulatory factor (Ser/Thr protein kinase)